MKAIRLAAAALAAPALVACDQGTVFLEMTDAPVDDATGVTIQFKGVELVRADGSVETFDFTPRQVAMLDLQNGNTEFLVDGLDVTEGEFRSVRLKIDAGAGNNVSTVVDGTGSHRLVLVSSPDLEAEAAFTVRKQDETRLLLDFDLRRSIRAGTGGDYELAPFLRLVPVDQAGEISGTVAASLRTDPGCKGAVYVYHGHGTVPGDVGSATQPITSDRVDAGGNYRIVALPAGPYTAAFTCAERDSQNPESLTFTTKGSVTVTAGADTDVDFP